MNSVKSKYKNPDKMIARLQKRIESLRHAWDCSVKAHNKRYDREHGEQSVNWAKNIIQQQSCSDPNVFNSMEVGDKVINVGVVTKIETQKHNVSSYSRVHYELIETRRRPK